jgi:hypothetical protein
VEKVHPLQGGILRLKNRFERRTELPVEPAWRFYPALAWEFCVKAVSIGAFAWSIHRIYRRVAAAPDPKAYTDAALTPVADADVETMEMFQNEAARHAVEHVRRVKELTSAA